MNEDLSHIYTIGAKGNFSNDLSELNYLSISTRLKILKRYLTLSLNYQRLYLLNREWDFKISQKDIPDPDYFKLNLEANQRYFQEGSISAIGLAFSYQFTKQFSFGLTFNFWDKDLCNNKWKEENKIYDVYYYVFFPDDYGIAKDDDLVKIDKYTFDGFNMNFGFLWRSENEAFTIGFVFKTPFKADIEHEHYENDEYTFSDENMKMPASYGIGLSYNFSDQFRIAGDIYRTDWQNFISIDSKGKENSPVTKKLLDQSDIDPAYQIRTGAEYLYINKNKKFLIPIRFGLFYDPNPCDIHPDDYWGFSIGAGFIKNNISVDIAYQCRFGNDVGDSFLPLNEFEMDVQEHQLYYSLIFYFEDSKRFSKYY